MIRVSFFLFQSAQRVDFSEPLPNCSPSEINAGTNKKCCKKNASKGKRNLQRNPRHHIPQLIHRKWILHLLAKYGGPTKMRRIGKTRLAAFARSHKARNPEPVIDAMLAAIHGQTVSIAGAEYAELGVAMSAKDALAKLEHRKEIEAQVVLKLIQDIPQTEILLSMPGIGPRSAAQILMTVGDMSDFPDAAHLASYAGLSPRTNQSGTSIMSNSPNRAGNKN